MAQKLSSSSKTRAKKKSTTGRYTPPKPKFPFPVAPTKIIGPSSLNYVPDVETISQLWHESKQRLRLLKLDWDRNGIPPEIKQKVWANAPWMIGPK